MATLHNTIPVMPGDTGLTAFIDRWIYVFTAATIFVVVLVGFIPDSFRRIAAVEAGAMPPFPPILHVHAVLMGAWISLLLVQATLMASGRRNWHMQLGITSMVLAPAILVAGFLLVPVRRAQLAEMIANAPPEIALKLQTELVPFVNNIMLLQIRAGILFAIIAGLAIWFRRKDSGMHKRLMLLATLVPIPAALNRMQFLPQTLPDSPLSGELYAIAVIAPMFFWDLFRLGRIHTAYLIWIGLTLPAAILMFAMWDTPGWQAWASRIGGLG